MLLVERSSRDRKYYSLSKIEWLERSAEIEVVGVKDERKV
jgi:hypothetical protein